MKNKYCRNVTPAKEQEVTKMDEIDEIIAVVARWLQPDIELKYLRCSTFYLPVKEKIRDILER